LSEPLPICTLAGKGITFNSAEDCARADMLATKSDVSTNRNARVLKNAWFMELASECSHTKVPPLNRYNVEQMRVAHSFSNAQ
jgi:hypothetical protein